MQTEGIVSVGLHLNIGHIAYLQGVFRTLGISIVFHEIELYLDLLLLNQAGLL